MAKAERADRTERQPARVSGDKRFAADGVPPTDCDGDEKW